MKNMILDVTTDLSFVHYLVFMLLIVIVIIVFELLVDKRKQAIDATADYSQLAIKSKVFKVKQQLYIYYPCDEESQPNMYQHIITVIVDKPFEYHHQLYMLDDLTEVSYGRKIDKYSSSGLCFELNKLSD